MQHFVCGDTDLMGRISSLGREAPCSGREVVNHILQVNPGYSIFTVQLCELVAKAILYRRTSECHGRIGEAQYVAICSFS